MKILHQDVFREIKGSFGRFISLLLIIMLGVAFYAGIRSCGPDMLESADTFYDRSDLMDIRVISTMGLTDDDLQALEEVSGVKKAVGLHSYDFYSETSDSKQALKVVSQNDEINRIEIKQGRGIQKADECILSDYDFEVFNYEFGDVIHLNSGDTGDIDDLLEIRDFKIVGTFSTAEYLAFDLGNTSIGSGKLDGLIVVSDSVFKSDYYTQIDILAEGAKDMMCYSDEYDDHIESITDNIETIKTEREEARYTEYKNEVQEKLDEARAELTDSRKEYEDGLKKYEDGLKTYEDAMAMSEGLADILGLTDAEYDKLMADYEDQKKELDDAKVELDDAAVQIKDAEKEIADAQKELDETDSAEWYILDRHYLTEYSSYRSDSERIENVGKVFPVIFFIVAALVCLTTMTRMVDEERTQIGTLKALGYGKADIMYKYIMYGLIATVLGSVIGALVGSKVLPMVLLNVYKLLYPNLEVLLYPYNLTHCLTAGFAMFVCVMAATIFASIRSLMASPADLMRPVAPKPGRKLLLEKITRLWKKIPFTWKNAFRNFVRYKKRLFMTLFGIIGSTALLLVGFGLKDAVHAILYTQFGDINRYNEIITIDTKADKEDMEALFDHVANDERFEKYINSMQMAIDAETESSKEILDAYLMVPEDLSKIDGVYDWRDRLTGEKQLPDEDSVIISEKLSRLFDLSVGDSFFISEGQDNKKEVTVGGIFENYLYHYVIMTPELYKTLYGEKPDYNEIVIVNKEGVVISAEDFGREYMTEDAALASVHIDDLIDKFADMIKSMDSITLVLIVCAGALTFVVLYNLNNINISERRRELATLKVLGFYDLELSQYIYRENIIITIIGVAAGLIAGYFLNLYVVVTCEVDVVMFGRKIFTPSFLLSIAIAVGFTAIVNVLIHHKMKKIDMATSLKSVE